MAFRSVQSRIVVSFFVLIAVVQVAALVAVHSAIERSAGAQIKSQLEVTAQVFERLLAARSRRLIEAARILTGDFPFRQVVVLGAQEGQPLVQLAVLLVRDQVDRLQRRDPRGHGLEARPRLVGIARRIVGGPELLGADLVATPRVVLELLEPHPHLGQPELV